MSVRAMVSPTVVMKFDASSVQLSVTADDIARGYIDVPGTYRLTLNGDKTMQHLANVTVEYEPNPYNFTSIQIAARTLQTGEPASDTLLANYVNALPPTAAGPSVEEQIPAADDIRTKDFETAEIISTNSSITALGYRLMLPENIKPGNISVPLTLSVQL